MFLTNIILEIHTASVSGFQCSTFSTLTYCRDDVIKRILIIHTAVSVIACEQALFLGRCEKIARRGNGKGRACRQIYGTTVPLQTLCIKL